jgi:hypothetical protein
LSLKAYESSVLSVLGAEQGIQSLS